MADRPPPTDIFEPEKRAPVPGFDLEAIRQSHAQLQQEREQYRQRYNLELSNEEYLHLDSIARQMDTDEGSTEEYDDTVFRYGTALKLSRMHGMPFQSAYENLDTLMTSQYPHAKVPKEWYRAVSDSFLIGGNTVEMIDLATRIRAARGDTEKRNQLFQEFKKLKDENLTLQDGVSRNFIVEGLKTTGESSGIMARSMAARGLGSMVHPALGFALGAAVSASDMTYLAYMDFMDQGMPEDIAWNSALTAGVIDGVVEQLSGPEALFAGTGAGKLIFKKLALGGSVAAFGRAVGAYFLESAGEGITETIQTGVEQKVSDIGKEKTEQRVHEAAARGELSPAEQALEKAAEDLATAAYREYERQAAKSPGALLPRSTAEMRRDERWQSFKGGFLATVVTGGLAIPFNTAVNIREANQMKVSAQIAPDFETHDQALKNAGNKTYEGFDEKTRREIYSNVHEEYRQTVDAEEEQLRKTRLYSGTDTGTEPAYRDAGGNLHAENIRHTDSGGITTGVFQGGNPDKTENNFYWKLDYRMEGGKEVIEGLRIGEAYEGLKPEILQRFANDTGHEVAWEGETYTPVEGAAKAVHIGFDTQIRKTPENTVETPSRATGRVLEGLTGKEKEFFDKIRAWPGIQSDLEARAGVEALRLNAALNNQTLEEHLASDFEPEMIGAADAALQAAAQEQGGRKKGAVRFDPETGKAMISAFEGADVSTVIHEGAHVLRRKLTGDYLAEAERVFGVKDGVWTEQNDEDFAGAYEKYVETGKAPTSKLAELFQKLKEFMGRIYSLVKNEKKLSPEQRAFFDRVFRDAQANLDAMEGREAAGTGGNRTESAPANGTDGPLWQPDMSGDDEVIDDPEAGYTEKAGAIVDKAGKVYAAERLVPADRKHGPTAALISRAMSILDPEARERVTGEIRALRDQYAGTGAEFKAPNGKASLLLESLGEEKGQQAWYAVRTPSFKEWFGDWETAARIEGIQAISPAVVSGTNSASKAEAEKIFRDFGEVKNDRDGRLVTFPVNTAGKILGHKGFDVGTIIKDFAELYKTAHYAYSEPEIQRKGHKPHPNIKAYHTYVNKFEYNDGHKVDSYYIRFTLHEENIRHGVGKNNVHSSSVSRVELYKDNGETSNQVRVIDPVERSVSPSSDKRLQQFFESVNPSEVSQVRDANGEPMAVYHGTGTKFDTFRNKSGLSAYYFTAEKGRAEIYAKMKAGDGGVLMAVFLDIKTPAELSADEIKQDNIESYMDGEYDGAESKFGNVYAAFSPEQIKSATDNAGTYGNENPSILFQDEDDLASFMRNDPAVVRQSMAFDTPREFQEYYEAMEANRQPADLLEQAARKAFYTTIWEEGQKLKQQEAAMAGAAEASGTGQKTAEDFLDLVNSSEGLTDIVRETKRLRDEGNNFQGEDEAAKTRRGAETRALKNAFSHQNWENARNQLAGEKPISPATARFIRAQVRNNPLPYMEAWAVISGDDSWLPSETRSRLAEGEDFEYETDKSPEELRRIQQAIDHEGIVREIKNKTLKADDPRLDNYEAEQKRLRKEYQKQAAQGEEALSAYPRLVELAKTNLEKQEQLNIQIATELAADTKPEGITASRKQTRKVRDAQNQLLRLRKEYAAFLDGVKLADKANFKEFAANRRMLARTENALQGVEDLRRVRKNEVKTVMRAPDYNTVHEEQAHWLEWVQSHFDNLPEFLPKFIGPKAKNLLELFSDFTTNKNEYRDKLKAALRDSSYSRIERIVYKNTETRDVRPYSELTKAQRHTLYRLLVENETLFKDLGLDAMEPPRKFSGADSERIRKSLEGRIPPDILYKLENQPEMDKWQMADMETLAGIMSDIRREGREHLKAQKDARNKINRDYQSRFTKIVGALLGPKDVERLDSAEADAIDEKRAKWRNLAFSLINARRFIREAEGGTDGVMHDVVIGGYNRAFNEQTRYEMARRKRVQERLDAAGIKLRELWSNTFAIDEGDGIKTSRSLDDMLFYRRAVFNDRAYDAVVYGDFALGSERAAMEAADAAGRPDEVLRLEKEAVKRYDAAMRQLDAFLAKPENRKFEDVETIIGDDYDGHYDRLKEFAAREFNTSLGSESYYIPLGRKSAAAEERETIQEIFASAGVAPRSLEKGFTLERQDISPWHQQPVKTGLYKTWNDMVTKQEHLMAYAGYLRDMRQIFQGRGSETLMSNIKRKFSTAGTEYIEHFISRIANPQTQRDYTNLNTMTRLMRGHYPAAVLAFRLSSIVKQAITSPPPFLQFMSVGEYAAAGVECLSEETRNKIRELSPYMASRVVDPANEFIRQMEMETVMGKGGKYEAALAKAEKIGMKPLEWIDSVCVMPGWWAAYKQKLAALERAGGTDAAVIQEKAVRFADQVVQDTQPSARQVDLPPVFWNRENPFMQMFLQFQVPQSVIMQNLFVDAPNNFKQGRIREGLTTFAIYALTAALVGLLDEDDEDEKLNLKRRGIDAFAGYIESIPVYGGYAAYAVEGLLKDGKLRTSQFKPFPVGDEAFKAVNAVTQGQWDRAFIRSLKTFGYYSGLPVGLAGEIEKAVETGNWAVLLGWK